MSGLMRRWLHRWYGADGLLVLDPQDAQLKALGLPLWAKEFEGDGVHAACSSVAMDGRRTSEKTMCFGSMKSKAARV